MNKFEDFPEQPRVMSDAEGEELFQNMLRQIAEFKPDVIIAVNRSGFSYAMWVAQILKLPLGVYYPKQGYCIIPAQRPKRVVFVDDNILQGTTFTAAQRYMEKSYPGIDYKWAVLFSDWHTPENVRDAIIQGTRLPYFAEEPMWGSRKVSADYGIRYRDEDSV